MGKRFVSVCFRHLHTDWFSIREPSLREIPFVLASPSHNKMIVSSANAHALEQGIEPGIAVADARAVFPGIMVKNEIPNLGERLLKKLAEWCIRFSPCVAMDLPDGLLVDASGCAHLWGGEQNYLQAIQQNLSSRGYHISLAMADTPAAAWGLARYSGEKITIVHDALAPSILNLPTEAMRLNEENIRTLYSLGLRRIQDFIRMPYSALRRRFGQHIIDRIHRLTGIQIDLLQPVVPQEPYEARLPCLEPIITSTGVEMALQKLLEQLLQKLTQEQKGIRTAIFRSYAADGKVYSMQIGTNRPSLNLSHLFSLFSLKLDTVCVSAGIELFTLTASTVEDFDAPQTSIWEGSGGLEDVKISELIDHIESRNGKNVVKRYLPVENHLPEKSFKQAGALHEQCSARWNNHPPRPLHLLHPPEMINVVAPIPDYPPMMFTYKGKHHKIIKADGPERIEQEWWTARGRHRDYYAVEDEEGKRYWLFRSGHYDADKTYKWFLHGFFV